MDADTLAQLQLFSVVAVPVSGLAALRAWRRARVIDDTPTSRVRSAAQGYVELAGRASFAAEAQRAPLSGRPSVWWKYRIEQQRENSRGQNRWVTINSGTSVAPFLLTDDTDVCLVDPSGAEVFPSDESTWRGATPWPAGAATAMATAGRGEYRYTEYRIYPDLDVGVIGEFRTLDGAGQDDPMTRALELLRAWKNDQPALLRRFDADHDGVLSEQEWERARAAARQQVLEELPQAQVLPRLNVIGRPSDQRPFLLAGTDLGKVARRFRRIAAIATAAFVLAAGAAASLLSM
ncbi:MAG: GIDE domain-containing protein [Steroidobacteraceae bacterium]